MTVYTTVDGSSVEDSTENEERKKPGRIVICSVPLNNCRIECRPSCHTE